MAIKILKGFFLGIIANCMGIYLYVYFFAKYSFETTMESSIEQGYIGGLIGLGAILNLILFFFFLTTKLFNFKKKAQPYEARGVLMATIIAALAILYFEF